MTQVAQLLAGPEHFHVEEVLAYLPCGAGEHLYAQIEKQDLTTEMVASELARLCDRPRAAVGFAGRKDRRAITRQWFSVQGAREDQLASLPERTGGRARVLELGRHRNKLRLGHLHGNRFRLVLEAPDPAKAMSHLERALGSMAEEGIPNRFGTQRFGRNGSTLRIARALALGDPAEAVRWLIDPLGEWQPGSPLPGGQRRGVEGRVRAVLERSPSNAKGALRAAGRDFHQLAASAGQSAIFNAVLDARAANGLLHRLRAGDVVRKRGGGPFVCAPEDVEDVNRRAAPGCLELVATGPLPGTSRLVPSAEVLDEEREWSRATDVDWSWFERGGRLESPGERRPLLVLFLEPGRVTQLGDARLELCVGLPAGSYATELLGELGVAVPDERFAPQTSAMLGA